MVSPCIVFTGSDMVSVLNDLCNFRMVMNGYAFLDKSVFDDAGFGFIKHIRPIPIAAHKIMDFHTPGGQSLDHLHRNDAASDNHGGLGMPGHGKDVAGVFKGIQLHYTF